MALRVLAISGSLRKPSFTEKLLDYLIEGMGDVEIIKFYPHKMDIGPCTSCWSCWTGKNKGECVQKDDFQQIFDAYKKCDFFLLAAPVYVFGYPATVKNMIDRFFVNLNPSQIKLENGLTMHPLNYHSEAKAVLISSCGFPDLENFELMSKHFKKWSTDFHRYAGEVLVPAAGAAGVPGLFNETYESIKQAGRELVENGVISEETMKTISDVPVDKDDYREMVNANFKGGLAGKARTIALGTKMIREKNKR